MPPPVFRQGFLSGSNGPRANPHKLISDRKRKVDAFGDKFASIGRVEETVARKVASSLAAVQPTVAKCKEIVAGLEPAIQYNKELDAEISGILNSPGLAAVLADPHALQDVAGKFTDDVGRQLLSLSSAYLGTEAYTNMAVSHSQRIPDITGPAAAQLAHKLETLGIDHQRALEEKDDKIAALEKDLATARDEATSSAALAQERESALIKQKADTDRLKENVEESLSRLEQAIKDNDRWAKEREAVDNVLGEEIQKRCELSKENNRLIAENEGLLQDTHRLRQGRNKARTDTEMMASRLACLLQLHSMDGDPPEMDAEERDRLMEKVTKETELAKTEMLDHRREAAARLVEAEHAKTAAEAEVGRLHKVVEETDKKLFQQSQLVAQLQIEATSLHNVILVKGQRVEVLDRSVQKQNATICQRQLQLRQAKKDKEALQNRLGEVELECVSLQAASDKNAESAQAEVAKAKAAMDQLSRTRLESTKAASELQLRCSTLETDKRDLTLDRDVLETRLATADELSRSAAAEVTQLSTRLNKSVAEIAELKINSGVKDSKIRELEQNMAKEAAEFAVRLSEAVHKGDEKLKEAQTSANSLQSQLEREARDMVRKLKGTIADLEGSLAQANRDLAAEKNRAGQAAADLAAVRGSLTQSTTDIDAEKARTTRAETELAVIQVSLAQAKEDIVAEKARCTQAATNLATVQESLSQANADIVAKEAHITRAETNLAAVQGFLAQVKADIAVEKERVRSLEQDRQSVLNSLVEYFSADSVPYALGTQLALVAQAPGVCVANGAAPSLWALELWDTDVAPIQPTMQVGGLYAALCNKSWSSCVFYSLTGFTAALAHTDNVHIATTQLLLGQAFQALETLDTTPVAYVCGLAICQLFAVMRRWPALSVPLIEETAAQLPAFVATLVMDILVRPEFTSSPSLLEHGYLSLFTQPDSPVAFVVDKRLGVIRVVNKTRCVWEDDTSISIRAPDGQDDVVIPLDSVSTANWLLPYWLL
jgi:hypothetical protein